MGRALGNGPSADRSSLGDVLQFVEPGRRFPVARCSPVAAWRQRTTGPHLRPVRNARALELAGLEEPVKERSEVAFDIGQRVLVARHVGAFGPATLVPVAPG